MKNIIAIFIAFSIAMNLAGQNPSFEIEFTKEQMHKDFDQFLQILDAVNIQGEVRKMATNYNVGEEIRQHRSQIEDINSYWGFINFLDHCLASTMNVHASPIKRIDPWLSLEMIDTTALHAFVANYNKHTKKEKVLALQNSIMSFGLPFYYQGDYYFYGTHKFLNVYREEDTVVISDLRVISVDGKSPDSLLKEQIGSLPTATLKWDYDKKKYYSDKLYIAPQKEFVVQDYKTATVHVLPVDSLSILHSNISLNDSLLAKLGNREKSDNYKICYYDSLGLLYIYMNKMVDDGGVFADSIKRIGHGKTIKKIIFDVRDNIGGSDYAWIDVLQAVMKDTLILRRMLALKDSELMRHYTNGLKDKYKIKDMCPKINKLPFLNDMDVICLTDTSYFAPDSNSLRYAGKIYVLQNSGSFSAAQSVTAFSKQVAQLVSVGTPTGNIAGAGFGPWTFQLLESKYTFEIDIDTDVTDASQVEDVFQDRPEIEMYPTMEEMIGMNNYGRILNKRGDQFLFNHDYLFKKVVEME